MNAACLRHPSQWVYLQLYLPRELPTAEIVPLADSILLGPLAPVFEAWEREGLTWFFIRFLDEGYHLRLRVHAGAERLPQLEAMLADALSEMLASGAQLRGAVYEPEVDKYCGLHGNSLAEQHFRASSALSLRILADAATPLSARALRLLAAMLNAAGLSPLLAASWCRAHYNYWAHCFGAPPDCEEQDAAMFARSGGSIAASVNAQPDTGWLAQWRVAIGHDLDRLRAAERAGLLEDPARVRGDGHQRYQYPLTELSMLPNFWHMLCNRLGVSIRQEMRLAYCLMRHLGEQHGIEPFTMKISLIPEQT